MLAPEEQSVTHLPAGEGETLWVLGLFATLKAQSEEVSFYEGICPPEAGPPPNIHYQQDEAFYVLEGTFSFLSGDETIETGPGSFVWIPRGTVHTFKNIGDSTGKVLFASTFPGSHERFFRDVGIPVSDMTTFEPPQAPQTWRKSWPALRETTYILCCQRRGAADLQPSGSLGVTRDLWPGG